MFGFRDFIYTGAAGMRPVRNRAMDGLFANFIPKAGHHNMLALSLGRLSFGSVFFGRSKKMNSAVRPRLCENSTDDIILLSS